MRLKGLVLFSIVICISSLGLYSISYREYTPIKVVSSQKQSASGCIPAICLSYGTDKSVMYPNANFFLRCEAYHNRDWNLFVRNNLKTLGVKENLVDARILSLYFSKKSRNVVGVSIIFEKRDKGYLLSYYEFSTDDYYKGIFGKIGDVN